MTNGPLVRSIVVSRRVEAAYDLHSAYPVLANMHSRCVVSNRLSAKIRIAFQFGWCNKRRTYEHLTVTSMADIRSCGARYRCF
jgi:hypothetical protein